MPLKVTSKLWFISLSIDFNSWFFIFADKIFVALSYDIWKEKNKFLIKVWGEPLFCEITAFKS